MSVYHGLNEFAGEPGHGAHDRSLLLVHAQKPIQFGNRFADEDRSNRTLAAAAIPAAYMGLGAIASERYIVKRNDPAHRNGSAYSIALIVHAARRS